MNDFSHEENALLRQKIRNIVAKVKELFGDSVDPYSKGWDAAIEEVLEIVTIETGLSIEEILNPKCN